MEKTIKRNRIKGDRSVASAIYKIVFLILLCVYALSIIATFLFAFMTSFKTGDAYNLNLLGLPFGKDFTVKNYVDVFTVFRAKVTRGGVSGYVGITDMLISSLVYSVGGALLASIACCVTAYAVSRFNNWMSGVIYSIVIITMALPIVGSLPSELQVLLMLNLYNKRIGLLFLSSSFLGMHFLVFHASFKSIPKDFAEAAKIDGAGEWRIFLTIMFPLVKLAFFTIFLLKFMVFWNNYETPMIHTPDYPVLALGVFRINHGENVVTGDLKVTTMPHKLASSMIVLVPVLILFLFTHKRLIGNVSMGGVKG